MWDKGEERKIRDCPAPMVQISWLKHYNLSPKQVNPHASL